MICIPHQLIWAVVGLVCVWSVVRTAKNWNSSIHQPAGFIDFIAGMIAFLFSIISGIYVICIVASIIKHFFTIC